MAFYNKTDLVYNDYKWTAYPTDDPKIRGPLYSTLFNRHEGYEVLYFINKFAEIHDLKLKHDGEKIERMIRQYLPAETRSQEKVRAWVEVNWPNYTL